MGLYIVTKTQMNYENSKTKQVSGDEATDEASRVREVMTRSHARGESIHEVRSAVRSLRFEGKSVH